MQRLTEGAQDQCPLWAPDGRHIAFFGRDSTKDLSFLGWVRADGSSAVHRILEDRMMAGSIPRSFSLNGDRLVYQVWGATTYGDIWTVALDMNDPEHPKPGKPEAILNSPNHEAWATFSPDGKWLAYDCQELGKSEVYVMPFPATGARHQISTGGGVDAIWSRKAPELFYSNNANQIMVVSYEIRDQAFLPGKPRLWSESKVIPGQLGAMGRLDLAPDGRRFAVITPLKTEESAGSSNLVLVTNFFDELRRRVPVKSGQ
jgi:hypothetical protein